MYIGDITNKEMSSRMYEIISRKWASNAEVLIQNIVILIIHLEIAEIVSYEC